MRLMITAVRRPAFGPGGAGGMLRECQLLTCASTLRTIEVVGELPAINFALGWDGEIRLALA